MSSSLLNLKASLERFRLYCPAQEIEVVEYSQIPGTYNGVVALYHPNVVTNPDEVWLYVYRIGSEEAALIEEFMKLVQAVSRDTSPQLQEPRSVPMLGDSPLYNPAAIAPEALQQAVRVYIDESLSITELVETESGARVTGEVQNENPDSQ